MDINKLHLYLTISLLASCSTYTPIKDLDDNQLKDTNKNIKPKESLIVTDKCNSNSIGKYIKLGWSIEKKDITDITCKWKSVPANQNCDVNRDKGCKITIPDIKGKQIKYYLTK